MSGSLPDLPELVVEDGSMPAGANSYVTLDYMNAYISGNFHAAPAWFALDTPTQTSLLIMATRYLDQRATWNGVTTASYDALEDSTNYIETWAVLPSPNTEPTQSLRWPRTGVFDIDGNCIPGNVIPKQLMDATCEMARYMIAQDRSIERPQDGLSELKVDVVTLRFAPNYTLPEVPDQISFMIRGLGTISSGRTYGARIRRV